MTSINIHLTSEESDFKTPESEAEKRTPFAVAHMYFHSIDQADPSRNLKENSIFHGHEHQNRANHNVHIFTESELGRDML